MKLLKVVILTAFLISVFPASGQDGLIKGHPQLAYWIVGHQPEIVIVLHGGPACQHEYLRPEFDGLSERATVIYYDQRGCGKSERGDSYVWQDHVQDLRRLIKSLAGGKKVFLAGSSWGSLLAILYAYTYPEHVKGIILSGTVKWFGEGKPYMRQIDLPYQKPHKQPLKENSIAAFLKLDGTTHRDTVEISKMIEGESGIQSQETMASLVSAPIADSLSKIRIPTTIFNGKLNRRYDWVTEYVKLFRQAELHTFEVAGHDPWFSDPGLFAKLCNAFILKYK